jgi:hypothetical protein
MKNDTLATLARVKALALAAMIEHGGKPCWVASYAPDGAAAALSPAARPPRPRSVAPQYRPSASRMAAAAANKTAAAKAAAGPVVSPVAARVANSTEEENLASLPPAVRRSVERALASAARGPSAPLPWEPGGTPAAPSQATRSGGDRGGGRG